MSEKYNVEEIFSIYEEQDNITHAAKQYCNENSITYTDSIRRSFSKIIQSEKEKRGLTNRPVKKLVYDIETSYFKARGIWSTREQRISHKNLIGETRIISVAWQWVGEDVVHELSWDRNQCDKKLMEEFLKVYNEADVVIGQNNTSFDNKLINTRGAKHGLFVNMNVKSFDVMRQARKYLRLPSYSMDYMAKYFEVTHKQSHAGLQMWIDIQEGTPEEAEKAMKEMLSYNRGDVVTTADLYARLIPYTGTVVHAGVYEGKPKWTCPHCGGSNIELMTTNVTNSGTIQRIMVCKDDQKQYKLSNTEYLRWVAAKQEGQTTQ